MGWGADSLLLYAIFMSFFSFYKSMPVLSYFIPFIKIHRFLFTPHTFDLFIDTIHAVDKLVPHQTF